MNISTETILKKSAESPKISLPLQRFRPYDLERTY